MTRTRFIRFCKLLIPAGVVLQTGSCFGGDPQFFITQSVVNGLVSFAIQQAFALLTTGLAAAG